MECASRGWQEESSTNVSSESLGKSNFTRSLASDGSSSGSRFTGCLSSDEVPSSKLVICKANESPRRVTSRQVNVL